MTLLQLINDGLKDEDKKVILNLDFQKSDIEIMTDMVHSHLLNFENTETNDKENKKAK